MAYNSGRMGNTVTKEAEPLNSVNTVSPARNHLVRRVWLHYYNDYLREHQVISEERWREMRRAIERIS